jgi:L-lactate dehydrogenase complex protein LldF
MKEPLSSETFGANARAALEDATLRGALRRATDLFAERRAAAVEGLPDWEALRERGRAIKERTLAELDRWLEEFATNAERAGTRLHWARDASEACAIVAGLVRERGARRLVKSKSMTTEEIGLNHALARAGEAEPVETDLGEWIVQLAGETPSHIIVPAIHKTKAEIAELFVEELAIAPTDDAAELTRAARRILREHFARADLGITGVNFAVAETGSILILENEGNVRMTTSLPRVHVAVMGIEKVIPRFADLEPFLRLLPRSGTGQHLTSYQSILTGPKSRPEDEGPEELHVVILDNGRSALLADSLERTSLACIRCGACLNACPVYREIGGHAYGSVYPGPIGAVITPELAGLSRARELPFASSLCGACRDVCPVKIDLPRLLLHLRARVVSGERGVRPGAETAASTPARRTARARLERTAFRLWAWAMASERRYRFAARLARLPLARHLFRRWTSTRELPPFAARSFRERWREIEHEVGP